MLRTGRCCSQLHRSIDSRIASFRQLSSWDHRDMLPYDLESVQKNIDSDQEWMKGPEARKLVYAIQSKPSSLYEAADMRQYIRMRGSSAVNTSAMNSLLDEIPAQRVLSSLLTFPLTLSYGLSLLFRIPGMPLHLLKSQDAPQFQRNVLIVGARSESSLPLIWWKELLYLHHSAMFRELNIRMVGPGLQQSKGLKSGSNSSACEIMSSNEAQSPVIKKLNLTINSDCSNEVHHEDYMLLHQHPQRTELLRWADAFVLFNPGIGNANLKEYWDPTIRLLLSTRKPILCTAYGMHDLRRDLNQLDTISAEEDDQDLGEPLEFAFPPHENPFKSWKRTVDPKEEGDDGIVTTNHSIYAVQAK